MHRPDTFPFGLAPQWGVCFVARLANSYGYWPRRASRIHPHCGASAWGN
jgi:hypothetical protein